MSKLNWMKALGASSIMMAAIAGCSSNSTDESGESNNGVSNAIKSPVMSQKDDKAMAGNDASGNAAGNNAAGSNAAGTGATSGAMGNSATSGSVSGTGNAVTGKGGTISGNAGASSKMGASGANTGGANSNNGVSNAIKSPVMGKANDKAMAGNSTNNAAR